MNEKEIIARLSSISNDLDGSESLIRNNDWDAIGKLFSQFDSIQEKIKSSEPSVETLMARNASFKKEYENIKAALLEKTGRIVADIEEWKIKHTEKISGSKDILDNISKFYQPPTTSYYIDRKE